VDDGFHTNPGLDGMIDQTLSGLEVGTVGTVCVWMGCNPSRFGCGSTMLAGCWVPHQSRPGWHVIPDLDKIGGWHSWYSLCLDVIRVGLDVVRVWSDHVGWMMGSTPIQAWMA
jgi:hypothetical protein